MLRSALLSLALSAPAVALRNKRQDKAPGKMITMGDSYSSGTGIHRSEEDYDGSGCWRDWKTTPGALYAKEVGLEGVNIACSGDVIPNITDQLSRLNADHPGDAARGWVGATILFTIGGNDLMTIGGQTWPDLLKSCIMSFYGGCHEKEENQIGNMRDVMDQAFEFYTKLAEAAPNARIRALGYPRMMTRSWHCMPVPGLALNAADWADDQIDNLNLHLNATVARVRHSDFKFVDVRDHITRGACKTSSREVNAIVLDGFSLSDASFHPSQRGYHKYFNAFTESIGYNFPPRILPPDSISRGEAADILKGWDTDDNGSLCIGEVLSMLGDHAEPKVSRRVRTLFREADQDHDEALNLDEFQGFMKLVAAVDDE